MQGKKIKSNQGKGRKENREGRKGKEAEEKIIEGKGKT